MIAVIIVARTLEEGSRIEFPTSEIKQFRMFIEPSTIVYKYPNNSFFSTI